MPNDEESSFTELGDLMKKIKAIESIARHHENAVTFHTRASQKALQEAEKARAEVKLLRELYKVLSATYYWAYGNRHLHALIFT
jgi:hypothetical protein